MGRPSHPQDPAVSQGGESLDRSVVKPAVLRDGRVSRDWGGSARRHSALLSVLAGSSRPSFPRTSRQARHAQVTPPHKPDPLQMLPRMVLFRPLSSGVVLHQCGYAPCTLAEFPGRLKQFAQAVRHPRNRPHSAGNAAAPSYPAPRPVTQVSPALTKWPTAANLCISFHLYHTN